MSWSPAPSRMTSDGCYPSVRVFLVFLCGLSPLRECFFTLADNPTIATLFLIWGYACFPKCKGCMGNESSIYFAHLREPQPHFTQILCG